MEVDSGQDLQNKNSAKKKKPVEDKAANHRKISDFFKTPEKKIGHKQKSLLQFFGKGPLSKPVNSEEILVNNNISPLANSDKENAVGLVDIGKEQVVNNKAKKSKHKEKKAGLEPQKKLSAVSKCEDEDDSIILLSDSSCSIPAIINDDDTVNKTRGELKQVPDEKVDITCDSGTVNDKNTNKDKEDEKFVSKSKIRKRRKSRSVSKEDSLLKMENEPIMKRERKTGSRNETAEKDETSANKQVIANEQEVKHKKCSLKVEDMVNLLKEVQEDTVSVSKKKKHRKKHKHSHKPKHQGTALKETHEISFAKNPSDTNEEKHVEADDDDKKSEDKIESGDCKDECSDIVQNKKNKDKIKRNKKNKELTLSYKKFTKNLEQNEEDKKPVASNPKEMSYTEYLEFVEKSQTENDNNDGVLMEIEQVEGNENKIRENDDVDGEVIEKDKSTELLKETKEKIFFTLMTSTPDHKTKTKKPETKNKILKVKNGKIEKEESIIIVEVDSKCENDKTDKNEQSANRTEINKQLFAVRKTQSTLSFGKTGLACSKPEKTQKDLNTDKIVSDTVGKKEGSQLETKHSDTVGKKEGSKSEAKQKVRKKKTKTEGVTVENETKITVSDIDVFATPVDVRKKPGKRKVEVNETLTDGDSSEPRRSQRKRYKVEAFQMDADNLTPIKIKLKRCPKSSSSEDREAQRKAAKKLKQTAKQATAQALLQKAKKGRPKKYVVQTISDSLIPKRPKVLKKKRSKHVKERNQSNSSEDSSGNRRSSRLVGRKMASMEEVSLENILISSSEDGDDEASVVMVMKKKEKKKKKKMHVEEGTSKVEMDVKSSSRLKENTPKKKAFSLQTNNSPAKKPAGKIAPMFLLGKKKSDVAASPKKPPLDPEVARQRQEFLSSGVPEELRKQTAVRLAAQGVQGYPPLPTISHVQQISAPVCSGGVDVWRLGQVELTLRQLLDHRIVYPESIFNGDMISGSHIGATTPILLCNRIKPPCMSPDIVELCLSEISAVNPAFPVRQFYTALFEMKTETEKPPPKSESMLKTDMKGILAGCTDMVVIDDGEEVQGTSKKGRSLKLKKKGKQDNAAGEAVEKGAVENTPANCGLLWTEKYCPAKSCDVLGNTAVLKKLQAWLSEWKHVLDREARKARKLLLKKQKGRPINNKRNEDTAWDDDSDFDLDSEDSEEDDSLCNTMLMSGPHGCGKTSSVYALALEQGFKVHEVNASSCRSGKQILSQLQEATQSHQVSSQGSHTPRKHTALGTCSQEGKVQPASKMPTAFTNLFKKGGASQHPSDPPPAQDSKKRKRKKSGKDSSPSTRQAKGPEGLKSRAQYLALEDTSSQSAATRSLNLSSTTLILFDEVDVVFEEDRGFLSAIQTFMSNTKVPIILTTADPAFSTALEGRFELVTLKRPPVCSIASYMQTLCTVEGLRTDAGTLQQVAKLHNCDMRRCLLHLQYFILSGGDNSVSYRPFVTTAVANHNGSSLLPRQESNSSCINSTSQSSQEGTKKQSIETSANFHDNDDDDDFVTLKPVRKRARILDEDSSSLQGTPDIAPSKPDMSGDSKVVMESGKCPPVHSLGMAVAENVRQCLQHTSPESRAQLISICAQLKPVTPAHLMYNNLHVLLPYQLKIVDSMEALCPRDRIEPFLKTRKRIKLNSDLYDSEASNDCLEDSSQKCKSQESNSNSADVQEEAGITVGDKVNITEVKTECNTDSNLEKFSKEHNTILGKSLSQFSKFYDTMSEIDQMESKVSLQIGHSLIGVNNRQIKGSLIAGLENNLPKFDPINELDIEQCWEYSSEIEGRSAARVYQECVKLQAQVGNLSEDQSNFTDSHMVLPVLKGQEQFSLVDRSHFTPPADYCSATDNIVDNLPLLTHSSRRTLHLDYLPFVRDVCRTEQARQLVNTKRRFHHYFDSIGWPLKEKTMVTMATTFL